MAVTLTSARRARRLVTQIRVRRWRKHLERFRAPIVQLLAAIGVMVGGASLIGAWMVGAVLMVGGLLIAGDALLRDVPAKPQIQGHTDVLERYRRAR